MTPTPIALVALLVASAAAGTKDAAVAAPAGGGVPVPPVCVGPGLALQWDGDRWHCALLGAGCADRTRCTYLQPACPATWGGGYLVDAAPDPRCGGGEGRRCTYRVCQ